MTTSALNPVKFRTGTLVTLTEAFRKDMRKLVKNEPLLGTSDEFFVIKTRDSMAEDEHTEILESTIGAIQLRHAKTGKVIDIDDVYLDEKDDFWAFFTEFSAERFEIVEF